MRLRHCKHGYPAVDPAGAQVRLVLGDRVLLGDVARSYLACGGETRLEVRHFNGERWPVDPLSTEVEVLERRPG